MVAYDDPSSWDGRISGAMVEASSRERESERASVQGEREHSGSGIVGFEARIGLLGREICCGWWAWWWCGYLCGDVRGECGRS